MNKLDKLPPIPLEQAIKHFNNGSNLASLDIHTGKITFFNNKSNITVLDLKLNKKLLFYLDQEKEYKEFEIFCLKKQIINLIGVLPLFISTGFFMVYFNGGKIRHLSSQNAPLVIGLILSYIGCYFSIKLMDSFKDELEEFKKRFYL